MKHTRKNVTRKNNKTRKQIKPYKNDTIILFHPNKQAIEIANQDLKKYLFRDKVNVEKAIKQHDKFKQILKQQGEKYIDVSQYVPKDTPPEQLANLLYTRDPLIKTPKGIILGNMREPARKHDTEIMEKTLKILKQPIVYKCKEGEYLEGGDFLINCDTAFIGTGARTNMAAAKKLLKLNLYGTQRVVIIYPEHPDKSMYRIHLDCTFSPFGCKQCVIWDDLTYKNSPHKRMCVEYTLQTNGAYKKSCKPMSLYEYLQENNYTIFKVSTKSQHNYGTNILELSNGRILVQDEETHKKIKNSIFVPFHEIHKMYGGLHCSSNSIFS
jgi:arginine deiminase